LDARLKWKYSVDVRIIVMPSFLRFVFTVNNYTQENIDVIVDNVVPKCSFLIFGKEVSATGTPHLQGFLKLKKKLPPPIPHSPCTGFPVRFGTKLSIPRENYRS
jgi:hypothetical protein